MEMPRTIPDSGALFVFGGSKFSGTGIQPTCFWLKEDVILSVSCGDEHTVILTAKGKVYVFGSNDWGQLGLGHTQVIEKPTCIRSLSNVFIASVACGRNHTLAATKDNKLMGFGNNSDHQLVNSSTTNFESPFEISGLPTGKIKKIGAGADFSVLLLENGDVYTWGSNSDGQLGRENGVHESEPTRVTLTDKIINIVCGYYHTALVSSSNKLYTFGEPEFGKLGTSTSKNSMLPCEVLLPPSVSVDKIACGGSHTAFISMDQRPFTFGGGFHGELGHGEDVLQLYTPTPLEFFKEQKVCQIYCGENFTCTVTENGLLYSFGDGRNGKLGLNSEDFSNQFFPAVCEVLHQYSVRFAACGGCHMAVFATKREMATTRTVGDSSSLRDTKSMHLDKLDMLLSPNSSMNDSLNLSLRSSLAREKRRKARDLSDTEMPSLSTLNRQELLEAVESFPNSTGNDTENALIPISTLGEQFSDDASDISTFNKVHYIVKTGGDYNLLPAAGVYSPPNQDPADEDLGSSRNNTTDSSPGVSPVVKEVEMPNQGLEKVNQKVEVNQKMEKAKLKENSDHAAPEKAVSDITSNQKSEQNVPSAVESNDHAVDGSTDSQPENKENVDNTTESHAAVPRTKSKKSKFCVIL